MRALLDQQPRQFAMRLCLQRSLATHMRVAMQTVKQPSDHHTGCVFVDTVRQAALHNSQLVAAKQAQGEGATNEGNEEGHLAVEHLGVLHRAAQRQAEERSKQVRHFFSMLSSPLFACILFPAETPRCM